MHAVLMTRGEIRHVNNFIAELSNNYVDMDYKGEKTILRVRVSPIQLWDISYPKPVRDALLNTILAGNEGNPIHAKHQKYISLLRYSLGLKKIGPYEKTKVLRMAKPQNIELIGIGEKEDYFINEKGEHVAEKDKTPLSYEGI